MTPAPPCSLRIWFDKEKKEENGERLTSQLSKEGEGEIKKKEKWLSNGSKPAGISL